LPVFEIGAKVAPPSAAEIGRLGRGSVLIGFLNPLGAGETTKALAASGATVDRTDGARVNTPDGWWLLRASNTQDVLVARAEAGTQAALDRLLAQIDAQLALSGVARGGEAGH